MDHYLRHYEYMLTTDPRNFLLIVPQRYTLIDAFFNHRQHGIMMLPRGETAYEVYII